MEGKRRVYGGMRGLMIYFNCDYHEGAHERILEALMKTNREQTTGYGMDPYCLEAAELLEIFQWSGEDVYCKEKMDQIREELADVLNYSILMADACGLDLDEIIRDKVKKNNEKYPVEKAYGSKEKYTELKRR